MSLALTMRAMAAAGCTAEQMAVVADAYEAEAEKKRTAKRENGAARQRRYRERNASDALQASRNASDALHPSPKKETSPHTPLKEKTTPPQTPLGAYAPIPPEGGIDDDGVQARARAGGSRLPMEWAPSEALVAFAGGLGIVGHAFDEAVAEFGDYWRALPGYRGRKLDWNATFKNRLRELASRRKGTAHGNGKRSLVEAGDELVRRLDKQFAYLDEVRPEDRGKDGPPTVRLLPGFGGQRS